MLPKLKLEVGGALLINALSKQEFATQFLGVPGHADARDQCSRN
jgi:hypothetical protein